MIFTKRDADVNESLENEAIAVDLAQLPRCLTQLDLRKILRLPQKKAENSTASHQSGPHRSLLFTQIIMSPPLSGYTESWIPIESNPQLFTSLAQNLGLSPSLAFQDIWTLDADSTSFLTRPVYALVLVFPTDEDYEGRRLARGDGSVDAGDGVVWFRQMIYNACGLYGYIYLSLKVLDMYQLIILLGYCMLYVTAKRGSISVRAQEISDAKC